MKPHGKNKNRKNWEKHSSSKNLKKQIEALQKQIDSGTCRPQARELLEELKEWAARGGEPERQPRKRKEPEVRKRRKGE